MIDDMIIKAIIKLHEQGKSVKQIKKFLKKKNINIDEHEILNIIDKKTEEKYSIEKANELPEVYEKIDFSTEFEIDFQRVKEEGIVIQAILVKQLASYVFKLDPKSRQYTRYARLLNEANINLNKMLEKIEIDQETPQQIEFNFAVVEERHEIEKDQ